MHADQRATYVHPEPGAYRLNEHCILDRLQCCSRKSASGPHLGNGINPDKPVLFLHRFFDDERTVEVFAALGCKMNAVFRADRHKSPQKRFRYFEASRRTDFFTGDFAGAAAHNKNFSRLGFCDAQQFSECRFGFCVNGFDHT
jgi:hypothetical protein